MKLGLAIGYSGAHLDVPVALVQRAEELGYDSVWSAEAYGSDAITPLAFLAAKPQFVLVFLSMPLIVIPYNFLLAVKVNMRARRQQPPHAG